MEVVAVVALAVELVQLELVAELDRKLLICGGHHSVPVNKVC